VIRELDALDEMVHEFGGEHRDLLKRAGMCRRRLAFLRMVRPYITHQLEFICSIYSCCDQ
jgi:DNA-binding Xre family transcriptional regulator